MRVTNRWMQTAAAVLLLGVAANAGAAEEKTLPFPGGVKLEIETDAMTDKTKCRVFTDLSGGYFGVYGANDVVVWVNDDTHLSRDAPALLRVGKAKPIRLTIASRPHMLLVPKAAAAAVLKGLYARETMALRFSEWPGGNPVDYELKVGDFGAAYELARKECKWKAIPGAVRAEVKIEPYVYKGDKGYVSASFPGSLGAWETSYMPEFRSCEISASVPRVVTYRDGKPDKVLPFRARFTDASGNEVGTLRHKEFGVAPFDEFYAMAERAGRMGSVEMESRHLSLYGFTEAVEFAEKTCGLTLVKRTPPVPVDAPAAVEDPAPAPPRAPVVTGSAAE